MLADVSDLAERERIVDDARGIPLYLREFARTVGQPASTLTCPLLAAAEVELRALPPATRSLVEGAAVAGDPFDPELAAAAAGQEHVGEAVDELVAADIIRPGTGRCFEFRHPLVCRAVYHAAAPAWRLAAHERVAAELERRGAGAAARAHHVAQYARPGDEAAVALLVEAARTAPHWYEAALRLVPERDRGRLLAPAGLALARAGRLREALALLAELDSAEPDLVLVRAQLEATLGDPDAARRRLRAAPETPAIAFELAALDERPEVLDMEADELDPVALAHIARAQLRHDRLVDASATVERALALAHRNQQPLVALHELRATIRLRQLDADGALADAEAAEKLARLRDIPHTPSVLALIRYYRGDVAERPQAEPLDAEQAIVAARDSSATPSAPRPCCSRSPPTPPAAERSASATRPPASSAASAPASPPATATPATTTSPPASARWRSSSPGAARTSRSPRRSSSARAPSRTPSRASTPSSACARAPSSRARWSAPRDRKWRGQDSNLRRTSHAVYSRTPLTAREPRRAAIESSDATPEAASNGRPGSTSNAAYFGPPSRIAVPPATSAAGMNQRLPSATCAKR